MRDSCKRMHDQSGSIIVVALLVLLLMSIIGLSATSTSVTESFIVRNEALTRQNLGLVEAAAIEVANKVIVEITDAEAGERLSPASTTKDPFIVSWAEWSAGGTGSKRNAWYHPNTRDHVLDGDQTAIPPQFPQYIVPELLNDITLLNTRGEAGGSLRVAMVGWEPAKSGLWSLKVTSKPRRAARIMAEYVSPDYGVARLEMGIERQF
jgi:hypothetical protein